MSANCMVRNKSDQINFTLTQISMTVLKNMVTSIKTWKALSRKLSEKVLQIRPQLSKEWMKLSTG